MAKKTVDPNKPKKARQATAKYFVARITGDPAPTVVIAKTQSAALDAILSLKAGTPADLVKCGQENWRVIDTTKLPEEPAA